MWRRTPIVIGMAAALGVVLAVVAVAWVGGRWSRASYEGHSAPYWLERIFPPGYLMTPGIEKKAQEAFQEMGTNAEPTLAAAFQPEGYFARYYRLHYRFLMAPLRRILPPPKDPNVLRGAAAFVIQQNSKEDYVPVLYPLLPTADSAARLDIFGVTQLKVGPQDKAEGPFVLAATTDSDEFVRVFAARALWKITGETNRAAPLLEAIMEGSGTAFYREMAAKYLMDMEGPRPGLIEVFTQSLTNSYNEAQLDACHCLGRAGGAASNAIPRLREAQNDANPQVREAAGRALEKIEGKK